MTHTYSSKAIASTIIGTLVVLAGVAAFALPHRSEAATYAYVNQSGEVSLVMANDPMTAIATAFNRALHSGVILLTGASDSLVGDHVSGS